MIDQRQKFCAPVGESGDYPENNFFPEFCRGWVFRWSVRDTSAQNGLHDRHRTSDALCETYVFQLFPRLLTGIARAFAYPEKRRPQ